MRACPACDSAIAHAVGSRNGFKLVLCSRCGTVFTAGLPATQEEEDYSAYYHEGNLEVPAFIERRLDELVIGFERYRDLNRWLDIGCGAGALMRSAARRGWRATGTEVAAGAVEAVRSQGLDVRLGDIADLGFEPASFDVVSAVEVLEHVTNPGALLNTASRLVRPGGALYITTPHGRGISARLLRTRWSVMSPPEHLQLFSIPGLRTLIAGTKLQILDLHSQAMNPHEVLSALRRDGSISGGERVASSYRLNEALSGNRAGSLLKGAVNRALRAARLGDALRLTALRPG